MAVFLMAIAVSPLFGNFRDIWLNNLYASLTVGVILGTVAALAEILRIRNMSVPQLNRTLPYGKYSGVIAGVIILIGILTDLSVLTVVVFYVIAFALPLVVASRIYGREKL